MIRIYCNEGSLEGAGNDKEMYIDYDVEKKENAMDKFYDSRTNQMYGRRIKRIEEL